MAVVVLLGAVGRDRMLLQGLAAWVAGRSDLRFLLGRDSVADFLSAGGVECDVVLLLVDQKDSSATATDVRTLVSADVAVLLVGPVGRPDEPALTLSCGARGYLTKDNDLDTVARAVKVIAAGDAYVDLGSARDRRPPAAIRPMLSEQERTILLAYTSGMTLSAAARRAGVRQGTAKGYLDRVKQKYSEAGRPVRTKLELAQAVRELGFGGRPDAGWDLDDGARR